MRIKHIASLLVAVAALWVRIAVCAPFSADTHDVYPGDFNGDGKSDLLVIAKDPAGLSGIYATDASGQPSTQLQSWNSGYLGISWHNNRYTAIIGNFDGLNGDDVLLLSTRARVRPITRRSSTCSSTRIVRSGS